MKLLKAAIHRRILVILLVLLFSSVFSQIPEKAIHIADSVCKTRMICPKMSIQFVDSIYYPKEKTKYQDWKNETYFFQYDVFFKEDMKYGLNVSINEDLSIEYVSGFPDSTYRFNPCDIMPRYELWRIAKKNGLRSGFRKCQYSIRFEEDGIGIVFVEGKSGWYQDSFLLNAFTGEFLAHHRAIPSF